MERFEFRPTTHGPFSIVLTSPLPLLRRIPLLSLWAVLMGGGLLLACQVPVFRYALERWESDDYQIVCVPAQGGLKPPEETALEIMRT